MTARFVPFTRAIEPHWWSLWQADRQATPFQSPAWLIPWAEQFVDGESGLLLTGPEDAPTGLLPIYRYEDRWLPWGAGTSDWLGGVFSPHLDPADLEEALSLLPGPLDLFQLPEHSPLLRLGRGNTRPSASCVGLALPATLPVNMAKNLAYYRRRADRAGIGPVRRADASAFDALVDLHTRRWSENQEPGVLADPRVLAWHRAALPRLEAADLLRLYLIEHGEQPVGALYVLQGHRTACYYIGGFDPAFAPCGVGTLLVGHAIAEAGREGAAWFDFLRGEESYKYHWGAVNVPSYAVLLEPESRLAHA